MPFDAFNTRFVDVADARIFCRVGGAGPPLLLLHGCPQTHLMWHKIVERLARRFTVVAADLRGYGASSKPSADANHANYSFRAMAADQVELMQQLGFGRFAAVGHDRGARVLHRMALDHPKALSRIALLDILPTRVMYERTDRAFAQSYWEWFFFTQPTPFPETLLAAAPETFLRHELGHLLDGGHLSAEVWAEYLATYAAPDSMRAMCDDYRAGATIDLQHDAESAGRRVAQPALLLWGARNPVWARFDMLETWRAHAVDIDGRGLDCGHYLADEAPDALAAELESFF